MDKDKLLRKLEGLHTIETVANTLNIKKQSALNLMSKLKKEKYVTTSGGGKQKRLYKITTRKQRPRDPGMWDIINKHSPHMKLNPWYDHQVHGTYGPEEALIDAIQTKSFRIILASIHLFKAIKDWKKLYMLAKEQDCWQQVGALYDVAKIHLKIRKMPERYYKHNKPRKWKLLTQLKKKSQPEISKKWHIYVPFSKHDMVKI